MKHRVKVFLLIASGVVLFAGCSNSDIIPHKSMVKILREIYLTDGVILTERKHSLLGRDTIEYYEPILNKYGYTTSQFDSSIKYYSRHTKELDEILDKVIIELSSMEDKPKKVPDKDERGNYLPVDSTQNLWPHKTSWDMAIDHYQNNSLGFDIPVRGMGKYTISFNAQVFPDDQAVDARLNIFFYYDNEKNRDVRINPILKTYPKDSIVHNYTYTLELTDPLVTHFKGWLYDHGGERKNLVRHTIFSDLKVTFRSVQTETRATDSLPQRAKPSKKFKVPDKKLIQAKH